MHTKIKDPSFWNKLWQENLEKHTGDNPVQRWNKRAKTFNKVAVTQEGDKRVNAVINFLNNHNALWNGMKILDVGCGPGNFSIPFAQMGARVTALDPAENMLQILLEEMKNQNISSEDIEIINGQWEDIDIKEMEWVGKFDLVFASQSPGLRDWETLEKMNQCSRKYCFSSGFDGKRKMSLYDDYCKQYLNRPFLRNSHDVIYLINLLYALGFRPAIEFVDLSREETYNLLEAKENLLKALKEYNLYNDNLTESIERYLNTIALHGYVKNEIRQIFGILLWQV